MTPWTKLADEPVFAAAKAIYQSDPRRRYHGWHHVEALYDFAANKFGFEYDRDLDLAVLAHDVIYDDQPEKELRSAEWLRDQLGSEADKACDFIMRTVEHPVSEDGDNRMVMLDLAHFTEPDLLVYSRELVFLEYQGLHGIDRRTFLKGNAAFFEMMLSRYSDDRLADLPADERAVFVQIREGIARSIAISKAELALG